MHGRQIVYLTPDGADLIQFAPVEPLTFVKNNVSDGFFLHIMVITGDHKFFLLGFLRIEGGNELFPDGGESVGTLVLGGGVAGDVNNTLIGKCMQFLFQFRIIGLVAIGTLGIGLFNHCSQFELGTALDFNVFVRKLNCFDHIGFRNFLHFAFNHHDIVHGSGNHDIEIGQRNIFGMGVHDKFAIDAGDPDFRNRSVEGDIRHGKGSGSRQSCECVGQYVLIGGDQGNDHLGFGMKIIRKERTQRPVNQAGYQNFIV
ncbi:hypothetical protein DSECCO2_365880 [anaerobic digester metagenome]